jgi:hypothetical protein
VLAGPVASGELRPQIGLLAPQGVILAGDIDWPR